MTSKIRIATRALGLGLAGSAFFALARDELPDKIYDVKKGLGLLTRNEEEKKQRVVVLGSGWGALSFVQRLDQTKFDVVVVSPRSFFFYTPLLAGVATGTVNFSR